VGAEKRIEEELTLWTDLRKENHFRLSLERYLFHPSVVALFFQMPNYSPLTNTSLPLQPVLSQFN
jgi:hypothetical protein